MLTQRNDHVSLTPLFDSIDPKDAYAVFNVIADWFSGIHDEYVEDWQYDDPMHGVMAGVMNFDLKKFTICCDAGIENNGVTIHIFDCADDTDVMFNDDTQRWEIVDVGGPVMGIVIARKIGVFNTPFKYCKWSLDLL